MIGPWFDEKTHIIRQCERVEILDLLHKDLSSLLSSPTISEYNFN